MIKARSAYRPEPHYYSDRLLRKLEQIRSLPAAVVERLKPFLLNADRDRLRFLVALAYAAGLVSVEKEQIVPVQAEARRWLALSRPEQVRYLAEVWRASAILDMAHTPGLQIDAEAGSLQQYDPGRVLQGHIQGVLDHLLRETGPVEAYKDLLEHVSPPS